MFDFTQRWRGVGRGDASFLAAILVTFGINGVFLKVAFTARLADFGWATALQGGALDLVYILVPVYFSFLVASTRAPLFHIYAILLFSCCTVPAYFSAVYKADMHLMTIAFLQTNQNEAKGFLELPLLGCLCTGLLTGATVGASVSREPARWRDISKRNNWLKYVALPLVLFELAFMVNRHVAHVSLGDAYREYLPFAFFTQSLETIDKAKVVRERMGKKKDIGAAYAGVDGRHDDLVLVVVIGESARSRNFSLNGYSRMTNPKLSRLDHLVSFDKAFSCQNLTQFAVPGLMTRSTTANLSETTGRETSFISIFRRLGYYTAWLTTEPDWSYLDPNYDAVTQIALEADEHRFSWMVGKNNLGGNRLSKEFADTVLLQDLDRLLAGHKKLLLVLNTFGSHYPYHRDYITGALAPFQPICTSVQDCDNIDHLENAYDNTIFYADNFLSQVIGRLKERRALFLYVSDHGESIGEDKAGRRIGKNGTFGHGHNTDKFLDLVRTGAYDEQRRVPMIWWASDTFLRDPADRKRFDFLSSKQHDVVSHDNVFHSILDCAGIGSEAVDKDLSLCSPSPVPRYDAFLGVHHPASP